MWNPLDLDTKLDMLCIYCLFAFNETITKVFRPLILRCTSAPGASCVVLLWKTKQKPGVSAPAQVQVSFSTLVNSYFTSLLIKNDDKLHFFWGGIFVSHTFFIRFLHFLFFTAVLKCSSCQHPPLYSQVPFEGSTNFITSITLLYCSWASSELKASSEHVSPVISAMWTRHIAPCLDIYLLCCHVCFHLTLVSF